MTVAIFINITSENPFLRFQLLSILNQSAPPDEVFVIDDTQNDENSKLCLEIQTQASYMVQHLQLPPHTSFGKKLNIAAVHSKSTYMLVLEGTSFLHPQCVKQHKQWAKRGLFLTGISSTIALTSTFQKDSDYNFFAKKIRKMGSAFYFPLLSVFTKRKASISESICLNNFSFWREDFNLINGSDEDYEDGRATRLDIVYRLLQLGIKCKALKGSGIVYSTNSKAKEKFNEVDHSRLKWSLNLKRIVTIEGLEKN